MRKKLENMVTTYKRAKDRSRLTGEEKITWDYYTQMDELFGHTAVGSAPPGTTGSTPLFPKEAHPSAAQSSPAETEEQPGPSSAIQDRQASGSKRSKTAHLPAFFQSYEAHAECRTTALESLTRPGLANWRRLKEKRKVGLRNK
nr:uncharacterized protein LOC129153567 [Nothobranchius furzeri]